MSRILFLIDTGGPGGAETVLANLVERLPEFGWESRTLVPREDWLHGRLQETGADVRIAPSRGSGDIRFLRTVAEEIRGFRPSLIHAHFLGSGVYGTLASTISSGCPLVCTFHGVTDVGAGERFLGTKARILSRDRNRIVYVSEHLRNHLEPILGVPSRLGVVIYNGVPFLDSGDGFSARKALGAKPGEVLVGAVGNIRKPKDYPNLLRAARIVCDERADVRFVIVGEEEESLSSELSRLQGELGLRNQTHFLGFRKDASKLLAGFDIFVSSSSSEGLPLASLEAMAAGKAVVLTRCGGVPEMVDHGVTGLLVPPRDHGALAQGILQVLQAPEVAAALGERARGAVKERFSLPAMLGAHDQLYRNLSAQYPGNNA
jgi:glycosyltransferase involved in cell wall biosynthesis